MYTCCSGPGTKELNQTRDLFLAFEKFAFCHLSRKERVAHFCENSKIEREINASFFFFFFFFRNANLAKQHEIFMNFVGDILWLTNRKLW